MLSKKIAYLIVLTLCVGVLHAGQSLPLPLPEGLQAAMSALPPEARPRELTASANGAVYALLPNGCEVIVKEKHSAPVVTVQAWVRTGSIDENKWFGAGISHWCEHMLFKGTTQRPTGVLDQAIRGAGGDDNAFTSEERTVYHITCAKEGMATSFAALSDMLMDSTMPPAEAVKEHAVVYKEIERYLDNPEALLWETFQSTIYQVHPYRVPVIGYPKLFQKLTRDDVFAYYQARYSPQMTTFIAVGDFSTLEQLPKMAQVLGAWKLRSVEPLVIPEEPEQMAPRYAQVSHPLVQVPRLMMGFPGVPLRHEDMYALDLLASILGDGRPSRLYQTVKDKLGLVQEISAFDNTPMYKGYIGIPATVEPEKLAAAQAAIMQVLEDAKKIPPSAEELARAKRKIFTQHIFSEMTVEGIASMLGSDWQVAGDLDFTRLYTERIQQVTAGDVLRVAQKYLTPEKLNTVVLMPAAAMQAVSAPVVAAPESVRQAALQAELTQLRADPLVGTATLLPEQAVFEFAMKPSGLRVVVREDHSLPVANLAVAALGGLRWEPKEFAGAGNLLAGMLDRGSEKRSKLKLAEETENIGAALSVFSGRNSFGVMIGGLKDDLPKLIDLAADAMLHPSFPADELEKLKADTLEQIAEEDESLMTLNSKILRPLLYGEHPYSRQVLGTPATLAKVTQSELKKLHQEWVQPQNLALGFVGDLTAMQALELVKKQFDAMPAGGFTAPVQLPMPELNGKKVVETKPEITGAVLTMGFRGVGLKSEDRETLDLMAAILSGLGGRLNVNLREKQGLAYSLGVQNDSQLDGGSIVFFVQTDPKSLDKVQVGIENEIKRLRTEPVPVDELDGVKHYASGTEAVELQSAGDLAQRLALAQLYNEGAAHVFGRKQRLDKVTSESMQAAALKYLNPVQYVEAIVQPK